MGSGIAEKKGCFVQHVPGACACVHVWFCCVCAAPAGCTLTCICSLAWNKGSSPSPSLPDDTSQHEIPVSMQEDPIPISPL